MNRISSPIVSSDTGRCSRSLLGAFASAALLTSPVWANTVAVNGNDGQSGTTPGPAGASTQGTDGTDADGATAVAQSADAENNATAKGGAGGHGGSGGDLAGRGGDGGAAGNANASAVTTLAIGSAVAGSLATGGGGGSGGDAGGTVADGPLGVGGNGKPGGNAIASGSATSASGPATVNVAAAGGQGGGATSGDTGGDTGGGKGGDPTLGPVFGSSGNGGTVTIYAKTDGGAGGSILTEKPSRAGTPGSGADAILIDAVNGTTTGALSLTQETYSGSGGNSVNGHAASAGNAHSMLRRTVSAGFLTLNVAAFARAGGNSFRAGEAGVAGYGTASVDAENLTGPMDVTALGRGGSGGSAVSPDFAISGRAGGTGGADITARTHGDGRSVTTAANSFGGNGGSAAAATASGGQGGPAGSTSSVLAGGDGQVLSRATAAGGTGGDAANPGAGGTAAATATAGLAVTTTASLTSEADAHGGTGGARIGGGLAAPGGDAEAAAITHGLGPAFSRADATGGASAGGGLGGAAYANAQSTGPAGSSSSNAQSSGGLLTNLIASSSTEAAGLTIAQSRATVARVAPDRAQSTSLNAGSFSTGLPLPGDVNVALAGNPAVSAALPNGSQFLCLGAR
jgi:hypothetical protein